LRVVAIRVRFEIRGTNESLRLLSGFRAYGR